MVRKPFSIINAQWPWPLDPEIKRAHPWLMRSKCMMFHNHRWIIGWVMVRKPFQSSMPHDLDLWTPKSIGLILDSWRASAWSFMIIGGLQGHLWSGNRFQSSMPHDLDLLTKKSIGHILDSWGACVWSFMIIGGLQSQLWSGNHLQLTMPHDLDLWTSKSIGHILDSWGVSVWSFISTFVYLKMYLTYSPVTNCWRPPAVPPAGPSHIWLRAEFCNSAKNSNPRSPRIR